MRSTTSFRDPAGQVVNVADRVLRVVAEDATQQVLEILRSNNCETWMIDHRLVRTRVLAEQEVEMLRLQPSVCELLDVKRWGVVLEHERIPFPSYPYEWAPEMLHAAGKLTIELATEALEDSLGLKDATPYNILFRGPNPVFVDLLSFERRDPGDSTWLAYAQFTRTFLLPLIANRLFATPLDQIFTTRRDGIEPEELYRYLNATQKLSPRCISLVSIPTWLSRKRTHTKQLYEQRRNQNPEMSRFVFRSLLRRMDRALDRLAPVARKSKWSDYLSSDNNYTPETFSAKERFFSEALSTIKPERLLDVGCNTGHFSRLAALSGAQVVAIDYDEVVLGGLWHRAKTENLDILPLLVNLARPSPAVGWLNSECPSFLDRARGAFDCVCMLAVIHHMLVSERIPLPSVIDMAADLTSDHAIIEFVEPNDSMFLRLLRGRGELHKDLTSAAFEDACRRKFEIVRSERIPGSFRSLYLLKKLRDGAQIS
ncbi:MAG: class I SAM-dependent methyltransferase [Bryobacteraceae bacterium]